MAMIASPSTPLRAAHSRHSRSTARVESARTPSRSKRMAEQEKVGITIFVSRCRLRCGADTLVRQAIILRSIQDKHPEHFVPHPRQAHKSVHPTRAMLILWERWSGSATSTQHPALAAESANGAAEN